MYKTGFLKAVKNAIAKEFPSCRVESITVTKNKNVKLNGISVRPDGSAVAPTVYIDHYYALSKFGRSFGAIIKDIEKDCRAALENAVIGIEPDFLINFSSVRKKVCYKLVNRELNKNILASMPHRDFNGLAVTYYIQLGATDGVTSTVNVTTNLAQVWGKSEADLYRLAHANTPRLHRGRIVPLSDVIDGTVDVCVSHEYSVFDFTKSEDNCFPPMYYLSNSINKYGAAVILYNGFCEDASKELGSFLVIPSSVNELILVPGAFCDDPSELSRMVREINATEVPETEILSDKCLYYDAEKHTLEELA